MDYKPAIIEALDTLRKRDLAQRQPFRARAYATVIGQLRATPTPVTSFEDLKGIKGMGEKITEKIHEILATGSLAVAERAKELYSIDSLDAFQKIYGVGPAKATELVEKGIRTLADLRDRVKEDPALLNEKQHIGLHYYEDLLERIPREEMEQHEAMLRGSLPPSMADFESHLVGSFRRGAPTSGDIDLLVRIPDPRQGKKLLTDYVERMKKTKYIEEVLAIGEHKCMAICRLPFPNTKARRLDILLAPTEEYVYSLFYFTGSDQFNVAVRQFCLDQGYTLNEHRLTPLQNQQQPPQMETEEDLFAFLCLRYVEPTQRINGQQVETIDL